MPIEFFSCISFSEFPIDGCTVQVSSKGPGEYFLGYCRKIRDAPIKALFGKCSELNFSHVQPTCFLGSIVKLKFLSKLKGLICWQHLIERAGGMGIEIILHQTDILHMRIMSVDQIFHKVSIVDSGSSFSNFHIAEAPMGFKSKQDTTGAILFIFII